MNLRCFKKKSSNFPKVVDLEGIVEWGGLSMNFNILFCKVSIPQFNLYLLGKTISKSELFHPITYQKLFKTLDYHSYNMIPLSSLKKAELSSKVDSFKENLYLSLAKAHDLGHSTTGSNLHQD